MIKNNPIPTARTPIGILSFIVFCQFDLFFFLVCSIIIRFKGDKRKMLRAKNEEELQKIISEIPQDRLLLLFCYTRTCHACTIFKPFWLEWCDLLASTKHSAMPCELDLDGCPSNYLPSIGAIGTPFMAFASHLTVKPDHWILFQPQLRTKMTKVWEDLLVEYQVAMIKLQTHKQFTARFSRTLRKR